MGPRDVFMNAASESIVDIQAVGMVVRTLHNCLARVGDELLQP